MPAGYCLRIACIPLYVTVYPNGISLIRPVVPQASKPLLATSLLTCFHTHTYRLYKYTIYICLLEEFALFLSFLVGSCVPAKMILIALSWL